MSKLGKLVLRHRKLKKLTQKELATQAGVSESYISYVEADSGFKPSREKIQSLAQALALKGRELELFLAAGWLDDNYPKQIPLEAALPSEVIALPGLLNGNQLSKEEKQRLLSTLEAVINSYLNT
jgi:transcriptional regulator with XRE-family HTH domain